VILAWLPLDRTITHAQDCYCTTLFAAAAQHAAAVPALATAAEAAAAVGLLLKFHRLLKLHCMLLLQLPEPPVAAAAELVPPHLQLLRLLASYKTLALK
jgi:hypothetical protein